MMERILRRIMAEGWMNMYFLDDTHLDEFLKLISTYRKERSREYVAAYYLLTCEKDIRQKVHSLILPPQGIIDWSLILTKRVKSEKQMIIQLAFDLFNEGNEVNFEGIIGESDERTNFLVSQALDIRKNWPRCSYIGKLG
jgi:hypothetical protein